MPFYTALCIHCGTEHSYLRKIDDRNDTPVCCGEKTEKLLDNPMVTAMGLADHYQVVSPITNETLYGRSAYYNHMKKHGVVPTSDLEGEAQHQKTNRDKAFKASMREAIREAIIKNRSK